MVAPLHSMRGLVDDFGGYAEDVLYVPGELHDTRVPVRPWILASAHILTVSTQGFLFFTSTPPRDDFATMVLRGVVHTPPVELLAEAVAAHMLRLNDGRMWIAAHWRRTDCKSFIWGNLENYSLMIFVVPSSREMAPRSGWRYISRRYEPYPHPSQRWDQNASPNRRGWQRRGSRYTGGRCRLLVS